MIGSVAMKDQWRGGGRGLFDDLLENLQAMYYRTLYDGGEILQPFFDSLLLTQTCVREEGRGEWRGHKV